MVGLILLTLANLPPSPGENLLANPSFEQRLPDGRPRSWSAFVEPQPGAIAELDPVAYDGDWSAMLHTPEPYENEPANNWSQVVVKDVAGEELVFGGYLRTQAAGEAALWIQCFRQRPTQVVAAQTSSAEWALSGTMDWQYAEVRVDAPEETRFVVIRCVLKGQGSAWFDDLVLQITPKAEPKLEAIEPEDASPPVDETDGALLEPDLLQMSRLLQQSIRELQASNVELLQRVQRIQEELDVARAKVPAPLEPLDGGAVRHPLVPRGYYDKEEARP